MDVLFIKLTGGCMRPLLKNGRIIPILCNKKIRLGDIVLYKKQNKLFLHRVVKISSQKIIVEDDCGVTSCVDVAYNEVVGVYPTFFSGVVGFIYHIITKNLYILFRNFKNFFIFKNLRKYLSILYKKALNIFIIKKA